MNHLLQHTDGRGFASRRSPDACSILMATGSLAGNVCLSASSRSSSICANVAADALCAFLSSGMTCGLLIPYGQNIQTAGKTGSYALSFPNVWPASDLQVDFCELVSISLQ